MALTLLVDGERWRTHLRSVAEAEPGLVPVTKGNGYGFTLGRLARKAQWLRDQGLGVDTVAVGTYEELPEVASRYDGRSRDSAVDADSIMITGASTSSEIGNTTPPYAAS